MNFLRSPTSVVPMLAGRGGTAGLRVWSPDMTASDAMRPALAATQRAARQILRRRPCLLSTSAASPTLHAYRVVCRRSAAPQARGRGRRRRGVRTAKRPDDDDGGPPPRQPHQPHRCGEGRAAPDTVGHHPELPATPSANDSTTDGSGAYA